MDDGTVDMKQHNKKLRSLIKRLHDGILMFSRDQDNVTETLEGLFKEILAIEGPHKAKVESAHKNFEKAVEAALEENSEPQKIKDKDETKAGFTAIALQELRDASRAIPGDGFFSGMTRLFTGW